jgi:8-oxo-dGTP pyrophosphatase MutT (NUDIX family)
MPHIVSRIVEVCVFRFVGSRPEYLLLKRSANDRIHPGIWQIVTGTILEGEKAADSALRELAEETGLKPKRLWVAPYVISFYDHRNDAVNINPLFAAQADQADEVKLSLEHQKHEWLPYDQARRRLVWPDQRQGLEIIDKYIGGGEEASRLMMVRL